MIRCYRESRLDILHIPSVPNESIVRCWTWGRGAWCRHSLIFRTSGCQLPASSAPAAAGSWAAVTAGWVTRRVNDCQENKIILNTSGWFGVGHRHRDQATHGQRASLWLSGDAGLWHLVMSQWIWAENPVLDGPIKSHFNYAINIKRFFTFYCFLGFCCCLSSTWACDGHRKCPT